MNWSKLLLKLLPTKNISGEEKRVLMAVLAMMGDRSRVALTQSEIGEVAGMTQPSVSSTLADLVDKKLLTKEDAKRGRHKVYGIGSKLRPFIEPEGSIREEIVQEFKLEPNYKVTVSRQLDQNA